MSVSTSPDGGSTERTDLRFPARDDLMDVASRLDRNTRHIKVTWDSVRSDENQSAEGYVVDVVVHRDNFKIQFNRVEDQQQMVIDGDGNLYSVGSNFPKTGTVLDIEVVDDI